MTAALAPEKIDALKKLVKRGISDRKIAQELEISRCTVARYRDLIEWRKPYGETGRTVAKRKSEDKFIADLKKYERAPKSLQFQETFVHITRRLVSSPESCALAWEN